MHTVEDYLAKVQIDKVLYINKIPLNKIIPEKVEKLNPLTLKYKKYWEEEVKRSIEGFWVEHNGEHKYIPGVLYFYGTHWHILLNEKGSKSKTKKISRPLIRDLEWIKTYLYIEARGFSGFEDDDEYTCHREIALPPEERTPEFIPQNCFRKDGTLKKYIHAREYLWRYHTKNLGKALFENEALNVVDLESRGGGKSYTMSGLCGHNFLLDGAQDFLEFWEKKGTKDCLSSETLVGAIDSKYSDDLIKKIKLGIESLEGEYTIGKKTYPAPLSKSYSGQWNAGKTIIQEVEKKVGGQWKKVGSRSKFQHRSFMDNPFAANGTRGSFNVIDEVGFMGNLKPVLVQMKECTADGALKFGTIWMTGTGGDMDGGATQAVMSVFFDPATHQCVEFDDYYEGSERKMGFFVPAWMTLNQFKDDLGNTNYKSAIQYLLNVRNKLSKGKDKDAYNGELSQRPIIPSEVFLITGGNILPVGKLKEQLNFLEATTDPKYEGVFGHMEQTPDGKIKFIPDLDNKLQECDWPVKKGEDHTGGIRIWEQPAENIGFGYYLAGNDPYDQDKAPNSVSLGSLLVMKRQSAGISPYDMLVAEYTARPETARDFYEQSRLLLMYYNTIGTCLYENEKIGIKTYLENTNSLYLLASTPTIMKSNIMSNVNRGLGQHMSTPVKEECEIFLRDWLIAPAGEGKLNYQRINSKPLLKELINYNKIGNFDRVIALMLCIVQLTQMHKIVTSAVEEEAEKDPFFDRQLFNGNFGVDSFSSMLSSNNIGSNFN
ncbi:hypothetical protein [Tenacibaculum sp.]|uniref:hypothetical protein n=1 Tax=Tenacibaculum sp. TaxID=1906242 RepID=UPI003D13900B